jgi:ribosomal protein L37AE/L43A
VNEEIMGEVTCPYCQGEVKCTAKLIKGEFWWCENCKKSFILEYEEDEK